MRAARINALYRLNRELKKPDDERPKIAREYGIAVRNGGSSRISVQL
jgi:hypothetical protein